jgi:excinuclease ABC subunit C
MSASALDEIRGIGAARKRAILLRFKSIANLLTASEGEIAAVPGVGPAVASRIKQVLSEARADADESAEDVGADGA